MITLILVSLVVLLLIAASISGSNTVGNPGVTITFSPQQNTASASADWLLLVLALTLLGLVYFLSG